MPAPTPYFCAELNGELKGRTEYQIGPGKACEHIEGAGSRLSTSVVDRKAFNKAIGKTARQHDRHNSDR